MVDLSKLGVKIKGRRLRETTKTKVWFICHWETLHCHLRKLRVRWESWSNHKMVLNLRKVNERHVDLLPRIPS